MSRLNFRRAKNAFLVSIALTLLFCLGGVLIAQDVTAGADEFRISCASCHGIEGKGDGIVASILNVKPTDLTTLAKKNNGEFPAIKVYKMIDGREDFYAHGERTMPVWGIRYLLEHAITHGSIEGEQILRARIMKLVDYIESIQN